MSHRERCMAGVFNRILCHLGLLKDSSSSSLSSAKQALSPSRVSIPRPVATADQCSPSPPVAHQTDRVTPSELQTGCRVRVSVPVWKDLGSVPVVVQCTPGSGGVQGLRWYSEKLMMDEDGDVAQEFLDEVVSQTSVPISGYETVNCSFKLVRKTRPAKLTGPVCTYDGNVVQSIE